MDALGLIYSVRAVPAQIYIYFFNVTDRSCSFSMSIDESLVYFTSDESCPDSGSPASSRTLLQVSEPTCADMATTTPTLFADTNHLMRRTNRQAAGEGSRWNIGNPSFHAFGSSSSTVPRV